MSDFILRRVDLQTVFVSALALFFAFSTAFYAYASSVSNFTQTITAGTLSVDIVNGSYVTVPSPTMAMSSYTAKFTCDASTGSFGTASEQIYVQNPDAADGGWTVTLGASSTADVWDSAGTDFDYNDETGSGCTDGADAGDSVGGQMTVDASAGSLATGTCPLCNTDGISKGSSSAFTSTTTSITLLSANATSSDMGDWTLQAVGISQTIPAAQPAASDYDINMKLTVTSA